MALGILIFFFTSCLWSTSNSLILTPLNKSYDHYQQEYRPEGPLVMCKFLYVILLLIINSNCF